MSEIKEIKKISDVEYCHGLNRIRLMEHNIIHVVAFGTLELEDALAIRDVIQRLEKQIDGRIHYLIDLNKAGKNSSQARKIWKERNENRITDKVALFGIHPVARVLASFVMKVTERNNMRFFNTMEEALQWLKE
jgi:hypothetical protein